MAEYIEREALQKEISEKYDLNYGEILIDPCGFADMVDFAPAADVVEVGNCEGCAYNHRKRPQKCSCCRRNPDMKDCYEWDGR